jgi:hypothetical protein
MERLRMKSCLVSPGRRECQNKENGQQEVPAAIQVMPANQYIQQVLLEVQRDQLTVHADQPEVPAEGLAVPTTGLDATAILQEVLAGKQDMQPDLLEVPPGKQDRIPVLQETSHAEQDKSSLQQNMLQLLLEKIKREADEKVKILQLENEKLRIQKL